MSTRLPNSDRPNPWFWGGVLVVVVATGVLYYREKPTPTKPAKVLAVETNAVQPAEVPVAETNNTVVEQSAAVEETTTNVPPPEEVAVVTNNTFVPGFTDFKVK
ncbi:MAG: hypothetical protein US12_C0009G0035 [Parcubacteria group bacterium GW2011_GWA2_36_24]|nr:MAG: hypothetical protein US12_C0009G0035 [Parcubacteria group bacterium GW2011_GWA2_36_24]